MNIVHISIYILICIYVYTILYNIYTTMYILIYILELFKKEKYIYIYYIYTEVVFVPHCPETKQYSLDFEL